ncbi:MAG: hypothetical protein RJA69_238 [Pseudomonadota bacterium]|jgi:uncharacterized protein
MKWLLLLLIVLGGVWWLRQARRSKRAPPPPQAPASPAPEGSTRPMTQCLQCGLHLPLEDAVPGPQGQYCSVAHRQQHEA